MPNKFVMTIILVLDLGLAWVCVNYFKHRHDPAASVAQQEPASVSQNNSVYVASPNVSRCMVWASETYQVPIDALAGIMRVEGGHIGQAVGNKNGTRDLGPMQINSIWVPRLARMWNVDYQTAYRAMRDNGCENVYTAAWILKQKMVQTGGLYSGIAYYHSATPQYGTPYANKVVMKMSRRTLAQHP